MFITNLHTYRQLIYLQICGHFAAAESFKSHHLHIAVYRHLDCNIPVMHTHMQAGT